MVRVQMNLLGDKLRRLREQENLPLRKVAAYLDIDTSILSKMERGERPLNLEFLNKLSLFYKIDFCNLKTEFHAEEVAKMIYKEEDFSQIFIVAEKKAKYFNANSNDKGELK